MSNAPFRWILSRVLIAIVVLAFTAWVVAFHWAIYRAIVTREIYTKYQMIRASEHPLRFAALTSFYALLLLCLDVSLAKSMLKKYREAKKRKSAAQLFGPPIRRLKDWGPGGGWQAGRGMPRTDGPRNRRTRAIRLMGP